MLPLEKMLDPVELARYSSPEENISQKNHNIIEQIRKIKNEVLNNSSNNINQDLVRQEIIESWVRSKKYGIDPTRVLSGKTLESNDYEQIIAKKSYIINAAMPFIYSLKKAAINRNYIFFMTDENGVILFVLPSNDLMVERAKYVKLEPGRVCTEELVGTCAHVMCLKTRNPIQVMGSEHYSVSMSETICSSAPIFDWQKNLLGTINLTTFCSEEKSNNTLGLVILMAMAIDNQINTNKILGSTLEFLDGALIILDSNGVIKLANSEACKLLGLLDNNILDLNYQDVLGNQSIIESVIQNGENLSNIEIRIPKLNKYIYLSSARPIGFCYTEYLKYGCILSFKDLNDAKKITVRENCESDRLFTFRKIIGESIPMQKALEMAKRLSPNDANILLLGESGVGKEVFAQAIHSNSRADKPFVAINCAAIPKTLIESELFGYESGAFTGAERRGRAGKIEMADEGTLFLDEIGDMPLELQAVLLRVLEDKKVMRLGGSKYTQVDFRLIAATNKNLKELVQKKEFREDLYYRIAVFKINIPSLRERRMDILNLANYFIKGICKKNYLTMPILSDASKLQLINYSWPGNVRQLENAMIYAVNMCRNGVILPEDLPEDIMEISEEKNIRGKNDDRIAEKELANKLSMREIEKMAIQQALIEAKYQIREASDKLGISKSTLYRKIKEYNLEC